MNGCRDCEDPRDCMFPNKAWFSLGEIRFCRQQFIWIVRSLYQLREGDYPVNPIGSGYIDSFPPVDSGSKHAPFESACTLAGEAEARLERCGRDGLMAEAFYSWGVSSKRLEQCFRLTQWELGRFINDAISYCSGFKRKQSGYRDWKKQRKWRGRPKNKPEK